MRFGKELSTQAIETLRILKDVFGTVFKIRRDDGSSSGPVQKSKGGNGGAIAAELEGIEGEEEEDETVITSRRGLIYDEAA